MSSIKNKIGGLVEIDWQNNLLDLQPEDIKIPHNREHLKNSLLKHGFALPFFTWKENDKFYCLDGHTRKDVLRELQSEGVKVPKKLKAVEIIADNRQQAIEILLEVFNQKPNPFSDEVLLEWLNVEEIDQSEINLQSLPIEMIDKDFNDEENFEDEVDLSHFDKSANAYLNNNIRQIVLMFDQETHKDVLQRLKAIGDELGITDDNSTILIKLIEFYENN